MSASDGAAAPQADHPVAPAPAPWKMRTEVYWFFLTLKKLPEGLYDPLEWETEGTGIKDQEKEGKGGEFKGGLGGIMIVRYKESPVGK